MDKLLNEIFLDARTYYKWQDRAVEEDVIKKIYDLAKLGPTSANSQPLRIVFVKSEDGKNKLKKSLAPGNVEKTMTAPITAIFAYDEKFYDHFSKLFPHYDMKSVFVGNAELIKSSAELNSALQAAYFIIATRSLGLDCGPMSGFDKAICDQEFFQNTNYKSLFLCNIGYGDPASLYERNYRFEFKDVCQIL